MSLLDLVGSVLGGQSQGGQADPKAAVMQAVLGMLTRGHGGGSGAGGALGALGGLLGGQQAQASQAGGLGGAIGALGGLLGGQQGAAGGGALGALGGLLGGGQQSQGGNLAMSLPQLIDLFQNSGQGNAASSWLSSGANQAISGDQVSSAFGVERLTALASQLGMSQQDTASHLADILPQVVDKLSPNGAMPQDNEVGDMLSNVLGSLLKK